MFDGSPEKESAAVERLFEACRHRLRKVVDAQLDARIRSRVDPSDVLQDAQLRILQKWPEFQKSQRLPLQLWFRLVACECVVDAHRAHLGAQARDVRRESPQAIHSSFDPSTHELTAAFVDSGTSPSMAADRAERLEKVLASLARLDPLDRELVYLRTFECLDRREAAAALGLTEAAAAHRYLRALERIREMVGAGREDA